MKSMLAVMLLAFGPKKAAAIATAVNAAIASGLFTTTVACSGYSAQSVQNQMILCEGLGYTASYSTTTLTLSW